MMTFVAVKKTKSVETQKSVISDETSQLLTTKEDLVDYNSIIQAKRKNPKIEDDSRKINESYKQNIENYQLKDSAEESDDEDDDVGDGHEFIEDEHDSFELKSGGVFGIEEVLKIELPKFMIKTDIKDINTVEDKSTIILILAANETNQNIGKRVLRVIKNGFKEFKIEFHNTEGDVASIWEFIGAKIKTVDFGAVESHHRVDPRTIVCEIEYDNLVIDKEELI